MGIKIMEIKYQVGTQLVGIEEGNFAVPPVKGEELIIDGVDYTTHRVIRKVNKRTTETEIIVDVRQTI